MTNKEAIFKLIEYRRRLERDFEGTDYTLDAEPFDMAIEALERKHGKWITEDGDWYWCSVCGKSCLQWGDESFALSNYCPNCGADMRG